MADVLVFVALTWFFNSRQGFFRIAGIIGTALLCVLWAEHYRVPTSYVLGI